MRYDLTINQFVFELYKKGFIEVYDYNTWRPYCHVKDFARLIERVIKADQSLTAYEIFNVGSNKNNYTKKDIAKMKRLVEKLFFQKSLKIKEIIL